MARTLKETQENPNQSIKPHYVYSKLRLVCKHLVPGDQEDAHEFLRYLVEAMEKTYLLRFKNSKEFDNYTKETTPLNQILGGYLKSSVRCLSCDHVSVTFQHFQDLLLDIRKSSSIEEALDIHFARERLEDMGYKCESCKRKVSATKQFSMERAPITLCIQLKRFSMMGGKINKHVSFSPKLSLSKYSSRKLCGNEDRQMNYRLVSVVTHLGSSQHCGHYTAVGLTHTGNYYNFDDSSVRQIPVQNVVQSNAYIIFYELEDPNAMSPVLQSPKVNCTVTSKSLLEQTNNGVKKAFIGPVLPPNNSNKSNGINEMKVNGIAITNKSTLPNSKLVIKIGHTNTVLKTWNSPKVLTTPVKTAVNGQQLLTTGLTPDINNKLKVTTNSPTALARPNQQKSDINTSAPALLSGVSSTTKPTLPSMPKLDIPVTMAATTKLVNNTPPTTNGHRTPLTTPEDKPTSSTTTNSIALPAKTNGYAKTTNGFVKHQLVPYDDDSSDCANQSDDEHNKSPPIVKTNSGLFVVTNATASNSISPVNSSLSTLSPASSNGSNSTNGTTNGAKRFAVRKTFESGNDDNHDGATLSKLKKFTHNGYGAHVETWEGKSSQMENEVNISNFNLIFNRSKQSFGFAQFSLK